MRNTNSPDDASPTTSSPVASTPDPRIAEYNATHPYTNPLDYNRGLDTYLYGMDPYADYAPKSAFWDTFSSVMEPIMDNVIKYGPVVYAAAVGADALGMFGEGGIAGALGGDTALGASLGDVGAGLGSLPIDSAALGLDGLNVAAGVGGLDAAAAGAGSLAGAGSMIGVEGGAPAVVSVGAPAAAGGSLIPPALGAGLGAGAVLGSNPTQPINTGALQQLPDVNTTPNSNIGVEGGPPAVVSVGPPTPVPQGSLPPVVVPPMDYNPVGDQTNPIIPYLPPGSVTPGGGGTPSGGTPTTGGIPDWLKGLIPLLGGNVDKIKAQQDSDWWKSQLDTLQGMYKPGTPEATLMEDKMNAMDAATGRNSQYGIRAVNLASSLADKRAGIMTSPGYQNMANAYRGRSSQDLNGLFSALGNSSTQNLLGSLGGTISNLFSNP